MSNVWLAVDKDGSELIFGEEKPIRERNQWTDREDLYFWVQVPQGTIEKLIGYKLTWNDEPIELK